jgi:hypothetical protein
MNEFSLNSHSINFGESSQVFSPSLPIDELASSIQVSTYKGLSKELVDAQALPYLRPTVECKIESNYVSYESIVTSFTTNTIYSISRQAPDGTIAKVGINLAGDLAFWKIIDATLASEWERTADVIIVNAASINSAVNPTMSVSRDYKNGKYVIDVFYLAAVTNNVVHFQSVDSGATFVQDSSCSLTPFNTDVYGLATAEPTINNDGTVSSIVFATMLGNYSRIINDDSQAIGYAYFDGTSWTSTAMGTAAGSFSIADRKLYDSCWKLDTMNSIDAFRDDTTYYVVFSGWKYLKEIADVNNSNGSIYVVKLLDAANNWWSEEKSLLESNSNSTVNLNSFRQPRFNFDGDWLWLTINAYVLDSLSENYSAQNVAAFLLCKSRDFWNFSYPTQLQASDGTEKIGIYALSFTYQEGKYFLNGDDAVWQYSDNLYIADVTNDIINYEINESVGSTSSIKLVVGNADGKWFGPSPTQSGYQAITKDSFMYVKQGYYKDSSTYELFPRGVFFIDDINQYISTTQNQLIITARDWTKRVKVTKSKYSYNFGYASPYVSFFSPQNQIDWTTVSGQPSFNTGFLYSPIGSMMVGLANKTLNDVESYTIFVNARILRTTENNTSYIRIYPFYKNGTDYVYLELKCRGTGTAHNFRLVSVSSVTGNTTTLASATVDITNPSYQYSWIRVAFVFFSASELCSIYITSTADSYHTTFDDYHVIDYNNFVNFENFCIGDAFTHSPSVYYGALLEKALYSSSIALQISDSVGGSAFSNVTICPTGKSNNSLEVTKAVGTLSGVFDYAIKKLVEDIYLSDSDYIIDNGSTDGAIISLNDGGTALRKTVQIYEGQVEYYAINSSDKVYKQIDFIFRVTALGISSVMYYDLRISNDNGFSNANLFVIDLYGSAFNLYSTGFESNQSNDLHIDISKWHKYRVSFVNNIIDLFVDDVHIFCYVDNNSTATPSAGFFGFFASSGFIQIKNVSSDSSYYQIESISINPGDDLENPLMSSLSSSRMFSYSDMFGNLKLTNFYSDVSNYTYEDTISIINTDRSDKEYSNRVTVFGNGVMAISTDANTIASTTSIRDEVIVDYKIQTYQDAKDRADYELDKNFRFSVQSDPNVVMNVGSELFDVVTITNTDSNVLQTVRIYNQTFSVDWNNKTFSLKIGTGSV